MTRLTGSALLLRCLKSHGIRYIFGSVGEEFAPFYDEIYRDRTVGFFDMRHEVSGVYAAIGYSWISGRPSICTGTVGPGVANMFNGLFVAFRQSAPVIAVVPKHSPGVDQALGFKSFNQTGVFQHITNWAVDCDSIDQIPEVLRRAFNLASSPSRGPVLISINEKIVDQTINVSLARRSGYGSSTVPRIDPKDDVIRKASRLLREAERPVILADTRVIWNNSYPELEQLANMLSIPVLSATRAIRPFFNESSPLNFGLYEARSAPPVLQLMAEADLLLAVDCYFDSYLSTGQLTPESPSRHGLFPNTIIQIDSDPSFIGKNYPVEVGILGNSKVILGALMAEIHSMGGRSKNKKRLERLTTLKANWTSFIDREYERLRKKKTISPLVIARDLSSVLPEDAIISVAGAFNSVIFHTLSVFSSRSPRNILGIGADGSLGTGLSKAIGAKVAAPDRCVVAFLGDGEFWYGSASELETLARTKLPIVIVISNNGCFGSDKYRQLKIFDGRFIGVDFNNPNFAELARVFGLKGERVESPNEIKRAIRRAVESNRPTIVDIVTDYSEPPPTFSGGRSPV